MRIWIFGVTNSNDVGQSPKRGIKMKCSYTLHVIINDGTQPNILTNLVNVTTSSVSVTHCHGVIVTFPPGNCPSLMHREVRFAPSSGIPFDSFFGHDFVVCFRRQVFGDFFFTIFVVFRTACFRISGERYRSNEKWYFDTGEKMECLLVIKRCEKIYKKISSKMKKKYTIMWIRKLFGDLYLDLRYRIFIFTCN